ncbi:hypothetical protein DXT99_26625 [Pontibacter diazotrophicus]|uniref:Uncharacterized protein n=1 Tax=Pontibacter diazotrophicus TaxID=1400979 RepID=A0A3D8KYG1_9BACT|nr:hypothetical protein DXT99_26625 [Pontibacter diazotrophicus]
MYKLIPQWMFNKHGNIVFKILKGSKFCNLPCTMCHSLNGVTAQAVAGGELSHRKVAARKMQGFL